MTNESEIDYSSSTGDSSRPETVVIINCALNAPLMLIAIIGNTLVLSSILKTPALRSPSTVFLSSLAVSDLLVGLVVQPVYIVNELTKDSLYKLRNTTAFSVCAVSLFTITAISVDRLSHAIFESNDSKARYVDIHDSMVPELPVIIFNVLADECLLFCCGCQHCHLCVSFNTLLCSYLYDSSSPSYSDSSPTAGCAKLQC